MSWRIGLSAGVLLLAATPLHAEEFLVEDQASYAGALGRVAAGDTIILADGEWHDFEMAISAQGREGAPVTVRAQTSGAVILTGQSNLRIGGEYVVISGLVFRDGHSPTGEVVSFRIDENDLAHNSRVTQVVIDHFSKPDRNETDYWVSLFGTGNRFDHNHLVGKTNRGVTLAVRLNSAESRQNNHRIDHNYFGPRPNLGSNGGETLRIGTSHYAEFESNTIVENNIFDRTDGEVEIISIKSGGNTVRGNLFLHSRGALTLRHGDGNLVERNIFMGGGLDHTGGIRVINRRQTVRDNYMEGLRGDGFASALTVMNGVPNSPANRYVQVQNAQIVNNSILDSDRITFGAGADEERVAAPSDSSFSANLLSGRGEEIFLDVDADISGIAMEGNAVLSGRLHPAAAAIRRADSELVRAANGLLYPADPALAAVGAPRDLHVMTPGEVGVGWYPKPGPMVPFGSGEQIVVAPSATALLAALSSAANGDTLLLAPGTYRIERTLPIDRTVTVAGNGEGEVILTFARPSLFELREGARLRLARLTLDGSQAPDSTGNAVIRTGGMPVRGNLQVELDGVTVHNLDVNLDFDVIYFGPSTLADRVDIRGSEFENISGTIVSAAAEGDDQGRYNVEYLDIRNSTFRNLAGPVAEIYRGGTDESTFGPHVTIANSVIENAGMGAGLSIDLHGVQRTLIAENLFKRSAPIGIAHTVGTPRSAIAHIIFDGTPQPELTELNYSGAPRVEMTDSAMAEGAGE